MRSLQPLYIPVGSRYGVPYQLPTSECGHSQASTEDAPEVPVVWFLAFFGSHTRLKAELGANPPVGPVRSSFPMGAPISFKELYGFTRHVANRQLYQFRNLISSDAWPHLFQSIQFWLIDCLIRSCLL